MRMGFKMAKGREEARAELALLRAFGAAAPQVCAIAAMAKGGDEAAALVAEAMASPDVLGEARGAEDAGLVLAFRAGWGL